MRGKAIFLHKYVMYQEDFAHGTFKLIYFFSTVQHGVESVCLQKMINLIHFVSAKKNM